MRILKVLVLMLMFMLVSACSDNTLEVYTGFASDQGLEQDEVVYFDGKPVGQVVDIDNGPQGARVTIAIDRESVELLHSKSAVIVNHAKYGSPVEIYNRDVVDPQPLVEGQELQGLDSMVELGAWMVGDAIKVGTETLSELVENFQSYLSGEEFAADKRAFEQQLSGAAQSAQQAMKTIESDLTAALSELRGAEDDIAVAVEQLGDELSPVVKELSENSIRLIEQLESFANGLETELAEGDHMERLVESLNQTFEQLNTELEQQLNNEPESSQP